MKLRSNRSRFTVIGSRLKKQGLALISAIKSLTESTEHTEKSKELCDLCGLRERKKKGENYRDLQVADVGTNPEKTVNCEPTTVNGYTS